VLALFGTEWTKQWRRPRTYVALGFLILIPIIFTVALKSNPPKRPTNGDDAYVYLATKTGLYLGVTALRFLSRFFLVVVIALFAGDAIASEASWGNLRALLVRPIPRGRFLGAKLASAAVQAFIASALVAMTGLLLGGLAYGWHPLNVTGVAGGALHESSGHIVASLALATIYVFWSLTNVIAFGFMASTMTDTPAGAVFSAVGLYVLSQILDGISSLGSIRYGLPTHYYDAWTPLFTHNSQPTTDMLRGTLLQLPYLAVFLGIAGWWFQRKDILS
jgi:ABC-2 type transport system permease protein